MINLKRLESKLLYQLPIKYLGGHFSFKVFGLEVTIYGFNAMWLTVDIYTQRWGYICFRPPTWHPILRWKFYLSPNATPWAATFAIGAGVDSDDRQRAPLRRAAFGHNFSVRENWRELCFINDKNPDFNAD